RRMHESEVGFGRRRHAWRGDDACMAEECRCEAPRWTDEGQARNPNDSATAETLTKMKSLRERNEWKFFAVLARADRGLALIWWTILILRGLLPVMFAIAMGLVVRSVQGGSLGFPLLFTCVVFVLLQILTPIHQAVGANLGDRTSAWLYDRLTEACVR